MPAELVIAPGAELDIAEAYAWYEGRRAGPGEEFLSSVDACLERIKRRPETYPVVHESYRRSLTRRFPYAMFYETSEAKLSFFPLFRDAQRFVPGFWYATSRTSHHWQHGFQNLFFSLPLSSQGRSLVERPPDTSALRGSLRAGRDSMASTEGLLYNCDR